MGQFFHFLGANRLRPKLKGRPGPKSAGCPVTGCRARLAAIAVSVAAESEKEIPSARTSGLFARTNLLDQRVHQGFAYTGLRLDHFRGNLAGHLDFRASICGARKGEGEILLQQRFATAPRLPGTAPSGGTGIHSVRIGGGQRKPGPDIDEKAFSLVPRGIERKRTDGHTAHWKSRSPENSAPKDKEKISLVEMVGGNSLETENQLVRSAQRLVGERFIEQRIRVIPLRCNQRRTRSWRVPVIRSLRKTILSPSALLLQIEKLFNQDLFGGIPRNGFKVPRAFLWSGPGTDPGL